MTNINSVISKYDKSIEKTVPSYSGILGLTINGEEAVNIATRPGFVYVRLRDNTSEVISAFNDKVSPVYNLPVLVERKGNRWYITGRDDQRYSSWGSSSSFLPAHGDQHSFNRDGGGGGDVVGVYPDQFMPLLVQPSGAYGAGTLLVNPYVLQRDTDFIYVGNTGTRNLLPYKPTNNQAIMGLVYLDTTTGNPGVLIASGTPLAATITGTAQVIPYLPYPASNQEPLYAFRLVSGTSALTWDNLYNVRQFVGGGNGTASTGTSGVSAHNDLTGIQGGGTGSYFHLNGTQINGLVSGSVTTLHSHALTGTVSAHNNLTGIQGGGTGAYFHLNSPQTLGLVSGSVTTLHNHSGSAIPFNFVTGSIAFAGADGNLDEDNKRLRYNSTLRSVRMGKDIPLNNFADIFPFFATQELPNESIIMGVYAYGSGTSGAPLPGFGMYRSRGTPELPTPVKSGDILGSIFGTGYDGSDFFNGGRIRFYADADWVTGTYRPSRMTFQVTPSGSATQVEKMFLYGDSLNLVNTGTYNVNGVPILETFLATANTFTAAQTIAPPSPTDGTDLLKFTTERAWTLQQASTGGTSMLEFFSDTVGKYVRINPNSANAGGLYIGQYTSAAPEMLHVVGSGNIKAAVESTLNTGYAFNRLRNNTPANFDFGLYGSAHGSTLYGISTNSLAAVSTGAGALVVGTAGASSLYLGTNSAVRVTIDSTTGNIGVGIAPAATTSFYVSKNDTQTSGAWVGANLSVFSNPASAASTVLVGFQGTARSFSGNAQNFTGIFTGVVANATHQGTGIMNTAYGGQFYNQSNGGGALTNSYSIYVSNSPVTGVGSAITNQYGINIEALTSGATSNIGVRIEGASTYTLQLSSTAGTAASGITWGTDTNLYRSAANTLKTDDSLIVTANLTANGNISLGDNATDTIGFYGTAGVARGAAFTQTYSTATRTVPAATAATLTDNSGGTADTTLAAVEATYTQATIRNNFADLAAMVNKLTADDLTIKQAINAIVDRLQALGLDA